MKLPQPCLMAITDRKRTGSLALIETIQQAVDAGIDAVQLREKDLDAAEAYQLARTLREITLGRCLLIVNDRLDIALTVGADGIHLPERGLPIEAARRLAAPGFLVGRSVHSTAAAQIAQHDGADYVELGTIFATQSKPGVLPAGIAIVSQTASALGIPCLAIGGIDAKNAGDVMRAGAAGIAVVSAIMQATNVSDVVYELRRTLIGK